MIVYKVGGCIRDELMGLKPNDYDHVVVQSNPTEMESKGFTSVGKDFPVFLHPETKEEYALARIEKKVGEGHHGFETEWEDVTIEQDLFRRDLTINAIAQGPDCLIDPFNGQDDIKNKVLRHVSEHFVEDPLRVLRVARFAARFPEFTVAPETIELMREIAKSGELDTLTPERVFQELNKTLSYEKPSRFFRVLQKADCLESIFPEVHDLIEVEQNLVHHPEGDVFEHTMMAIDCIGTVKSRFGALCHDFGKALTSKDLLPKHHGHEDAGIPVTENFCDRLKVPREYKLIAVNVTEYHMKMHKLLELKKQTILKMLKAFDAFRSDRWADIVLSCRSDHFGRAKDKGYYHQDVVIRDMIHIVKKLNLKDLLKDIPQKRIQEEVHKTKLNTIQQVKQKWKIELQGLQKI